MKTPQRPFVVEYKANKRQIQTRPPSIWGSLDLQAVARQVEADGILPYAGRLGPTSAVNDAQPASTPLASPDVQAAPGQHLLEPAAGILPDGSGAATQSHALEAAATGKPVAPTRRRRRTAAVSKRLDVTSMPTEPAPIPAPTPVDDPQTTVGVENQMDGLSALDAENRRLKRLLIVKLCEENGTLRTMLRRFDID